MFARMLEFNFKTQYKHELVKTVREEILPILRKQTGFFDVLWLQGETVSNKFFAICLWTSKAEAERYEREYFPEVKNILEPFLAIPLNVNSYTVDMSFSEAIVHAFAA